MAIQRPYGQTYKLNAAPSASAPAVATKQQQFLPLIPLIGGAIAAGSAGVGIGQAVGGAVANANKSTGLDKQPNMIDPKTGQPFPIKLDETLGSHMDRYTSQNYYGTSADGSRGIERVGLPTGVGQGAFQLRGLGDLQAGYGNIYGNAAQQQTLGDTAANAAQGNANQSRALALGALTAPGPSVAENQLFQGQEAAARNALALARSGRGFGSGGQMRQAQFAGQEALGATNQQAAMLRAQEEAQRRQQLLALTGMDVGQLGQEYQRQYQQGGLGLQALTGQGALAQAQQQALADRAKYNQALLFDAAKTNANFANYEQPAPVDNTWSDVGNATGAVGGGLAGLAALGSLFKLGGG